MPQLNELATDVVLGRLNSSAPPKEGQPGKWTADQLARLRERLDSLVGPRCGADDVVAGSVYARNFAINHLLWRERWEPQT